MDRLVEIIEHVKTRSNSGATNSTPTVLATVWAEKKTLKSDESLDDKVVTINAHQYVIRYQPELADKNTQYLYLKDGNIEYDIYGFDPVGREQYIKINCERRE